MSCQSRGSPFFANSIRQCMKKSGWIAWGDLSSPWSTDFLAPPEIWMSWNRADRGRTNQACTRRCRVVLFIRNTRSILIASARPRFRRITKIESQRSSRRFQTSLALGFGSVRPGAIEAGTQHSAGPRRHQACAQSTQRFVQRLLRKDDAAPRSRAPVQDGTLGEYKLGWLRDRFSRGFCECVFRSSFPQEVHQFVIHFLRVGPGNAVRPILHH
jgi:hypothetical protein